MSVTTKTIIPVWPETLQGVDIVKLRFVMDFISPCTLKPEIFLRLGPILRVSGRQQLSHSDSTAIGQWQALFQPELSADPSALRKYQKPAPAFVMSMPVDEPTAIDVGDQLDCTVLFIGTGIPLIHVFLSSLIHLGRLGLVAGEGQFDVAEVYSITAESAESLAWRQGEPLTLLTCSILPLNWWYKDGPLADRVLLEFATPTRLMVKGKPLRKPRFDQLFPFALRRVTSMLYTHAATEIHEDISLWIEQSKDVVCLESNLQWHDWRTIGKQNISVGGFRGKMILDSEGLADIFWILAVASLFGVGKGATFGAGQINLVS